MSTSSRSDDSVFGNVNPFRKLFKREDGDTEQVDQPLQEAADGLNAAKKKKDDQSSLMQCFPGCGCEPNEWKE